MISYSTNWVYRKEEVASEEIRDRFPHKQNTRMFSNSLLENNAVAMNRLQVLSCIYQKQVTFSVFFLPLNLQVNSSEYTQDFLSRFLVF